MKAKKYSMISKVIALIILVGGHILLWFNIFPNADSKQICACAFSVMGVFGTIDINMAIDKFVGRGE